ncbi:hypothetical protein [Sporosarcina sp. G11-34]|nr:hypothetical protein [Sporosarcina sp. G11-34]
MVNIAETKEEAKFEAMPQDIWRLLFMKDSIRQVFSCDKSEVKGT